MNQPRQVVYTPVDVDDADFVNVEADPRVEAENAEFEAFKAEMHDSQDDAKVTVGKKLTDSRGRPMGRNTMECFECGIEDYTFSQLCTRIREDFGTGLYLIQGRDSKGKFKFKKVVGIQAPNAPVSDTPEGSPAALVESMGHAMADQQARFERMLQTAAPADPIDQMTKMMSAMGGMMAAMGLGAQNQQPQKTMLETLTELKLTKDIMGDLVGNPESGGVDNFWGAIAEAAKSFGGPLMQAIALAQQQGEVDVKGVIQLPPPEPEVETEHTDAEANAMNLEQMREQLEFLVTQAKAQVDVAIVVEFILDKMPETDDAYNSLTHFLLNENCIDECAMINPEVREYITWFEQWRIAMLHELDEMAAASESGDEGLTKPPVSADDAQSVIDTTDAGDSDQEALDNASKATPEDSGHTDGDSERSPGDVSDS